MAWFWDPFIQVTEKVKESFAQIVCGEAKKGTVGLVSCQEKKRALLGPKPSLKVWVRDD